MKVTESHNELFHEWMKSPYFADGNFFKDGVIHDDTYMKQDKKVLFIAKEPNSSNHEKAGKDFREEWSKGIPEYRIANQIAEWSYGIHNQFPPFGEIKKDVEYLRRIAFMNIKKSSGGGVSAFNDFDKYLSDESHIRNVHSQIEIMKPDIIILGLTWKTIRNRIFPENKAKWKQGSYTIVTGNWNGAVIIDFYHPSSRIPSVASYCLLEKVLKEITG